MADQARELFDDETLMAYADGELDEKERRRVEEALAVNADLQKRIQIFVRTGRNLAAAFEAAPPQVTARPIAQAHKLAWREVIAGLFSRPVGTRLAAAAALIFSIGLTALATATLTTQHGALLLSSGPDAAPVAAGALRTALETSPSHGFSADGTTTGIRLVQSFRRQDGAFCREFVAPGAQSRGVACRTIANEWRVTLLTSDPRQAGQGFSSAGAGETEIIDGYVHSIMDGEPLSAKEEQALIGAGWHRP